VDLPKIVPAWGVFDSLGALPCGESAEISPASCSSASQCRIGLGVCGRLAEAAAILAARWNGALAPRQQRLKAKS
jgi:hypothetical protein